MRLEQNSCVRKNFPMLGKFALDKAPLEKAPGFLILKKISNSVRVHVNVAKPA